MKKWPWFALSVLIVLLDQVSKYWVLKTFTPYEPVSVLPMFNITLAYNTGSAFSFLSEAGGWQRWFFAALAIIMSTIMTIWLTRLKENETLLAVALSLILGGAIGNLIDRLFYGYVIDFLDVYYGTYHWPAFNIADSAITIGVALMLVESFKSQEEQV